MADLSMNLSQLPTQPLQPFSNRVFPSITTLNLNTSPSASISPSSSTTSLSSSSTSSLLSSSSSLSSSLSSSTAPESTVVTKKKKDTHVVWSAAADLHLLKSVNNAKPWTAERGAIDSHYTALAATMNVDKPFDDKNVYNYRTCKEHLNDLVKKYRSSDRYNRSRSGNDNEVYTEHNSLLHDIIASMDDLAQQQAALKEKEDNDKKRIQNIQQQLQSNTHKRLLDRSNNNDDMECSIDADSDKNIRKRQKKQKSHLQLMNNILHELQDSKRSQQEQGDRMINIMERTQQSQQQYFNYLMNKDNK